MSDTAHDLVGVCSCGGVRVIRHEPAPPPVILRYNGRTISCSRTDTLHDALRSLLLREPVGGATVIVSLVEDET